MRQLVLKKKESHLLWQIVVRGLLVTDRMTRHASEDDRDDYQKLRQKVIGAWKAGMIVGGVRPKKDIAQIMPPQMLQDAGLPALKKSIKKATAETKNHLVVPHQKKGRV